MNETLKIIANRFSCRSFSDRMPDDNQLQLIARAAIQAPSGMNRQHWHIVVVKNKKLIAEMEEAGMKVLSLMDDKSTYDRIMSRGGRLFYNAPCMIMVAVKQAIPKGAELIDCGIAAQNIVLAAESLGLASLHCGLACLAFAGENGEKFKAMLKFPPGYECGIGVLLGYAKVKALPHEPVREKITVIE